MFSIYLLVCELVCLKVSSNKLPLVVEHFFKMRNMPQLIDGIPMIGMNAQLNERMDKSLHLRRPFTGSHALSNKHGYGWDSWIKHEREYL